jgi:hypothetical protein
LRRNRGDENLAVRFELVPKKDDGESEKQGRPIFKDVEYISISVPGNRLTRVHRPVREQDKARFSKQYQHWQGSKKNLVDGTPLAEWPQVTRGQVEELRYMNVHTVEQLAGMASGAASGFLGGLALQQKAKDFLGRAQDGAYVVQMRAELEQRAAERDVMRRQLAEQKEAMDRLAALVESQQWKPQPAPLVEQHAGPPASPFKDEAPPAPVPAPLTHRGPGRPRKSAAE